MGKETVTGLVIILALAIVIQPALISPLSGTDIVTGVFTDHSYACDGDRNSIPHASKVYNVTNPPPKLHNNYTLVSNDIWTIEKDSSFFGNVSLIDKARLIIKNAHVTFNGTFWARNYSQISITDANLTLNIPSVGPVKKDQQYNTPNGFVLAEETQL